MNTTIKTTDSGTHTTLLLLIRIYFLFPLLFGTYRSYLYELKLVDVLYDINHYNLIYIIVYCIIFAIYIFNFLILIKPAIPVTYLLFFSLQFILDFFFQNFIKYQTSVSLTNLFPLFCWLILTYKNFKPLYIQYIVSIGFVGSAVAKMTSGWLDPNASASFYHIKQFYTGYGFDFIGITDKLLSIRSLFFWKLVDYLIVAFEASFLIIFFKRTYYKWLVLNAVILHVLILLFMNIPLFFPFILVYCLSLMNFKKIQVHSMEKRTIPIKYVVILTLIYCALLLNIDLSSYSLLNLTDNLFCYSYYETIFYVISCIMFIFIFKTNVPQSEN